MRSNLFVIYKDKIQHAIALIREIKSDSPKSYIRILYDFGKLKSKRGVSLLEYYKYQLDVQSNDFIKTLLFAKERTHFLSILNSGHSYFIVSRNKYLSHLIFKAHGINSAELYLFYDPTLRIHNINDCAYNYESVKTILQKKNITTCVIKSTIGTYGKDVAVFTDVNYANNKCYLTRFDGAKMELDDILGREQLIFEALVHQTKQLEAFNPSSVNTIRFTTTSYPDGSVKIIGTFIKIGRIGVCVDNAHDGGNIDAGIDLNTGCIYGAVEFVGYRKIKKIERHPDTNVQVEGVQIENWEEIKKNVIYYHQSFPFLKVIGWDIALTDNGAIVIEVNNNPSIIGQLFSQKGWKTEIEDCYNVWKNDGRCKLR